MTVNPRRAGLVGVLFVAIAIFYFVFGSVVDPAHIEPAAITMLVALGVAMSLMAYVLFAGVRKG